MTKHVDTAFERHFSEPPVVAVKEGRTHCDACLEPLDPSVMHKCHGNREYQAPVISSTEIKEACPDCRGNEVHALLIDRSATGAQSTFVAICHSCRTFIGGEVPTAAEAIFTWNAMAPIALAGSSPKWLAVLPGDDERANVIPSETKPAPPDLTNYQGACPAVHVDGEVCDWCENTGTIPPMKPEGAQ